MPEPCCPHCGASLSTNETTCPFCRKGLTTSAPETIQDVSDISPEAIQHKQTLILRLVLVALLWGAIIVPIAFAAVNIAKEEMPTVTGRDVRFNRIEIQSPKYKTLQVILQTSAVLKRIFGCFCFVVWFQYLRTMGYSRWASAGHILLMFIPLVNLIVFLVMIHKGRVLIAEYS